MTSQHCTAHAAVPSGAAGARVSSACRRDGGGADGDGCLLAIDLGGTKCHGVIADSSGRVLHNLVRRTNGAEAQQALRVTLEELRAVAAEQGLTPLGVVIGIPALIAPDTGLAFAGTNVQWHGFDLQRWLRERVAEPFVVDNDVNLAALGEASLGRGSGAAAFVTLSIGTGVGAAIVIDGRLWRGAHNAAGEVGFMAASNGHTGPLSPDVPRLEDRISGQGITRRAAALLAAGEPSRLDLDGLDPQVIFQAAAAGDPLADAVVRGVVDDTAAAILAICTVVDPDVVVLDGGIGRALAPWLDLIRARLAELAPFPPQVGVSTLAPNATIVGAIRRGMQILPPDGQ